MKRSNSILWAVLAGAAVTAGLIVASKIIKQNTDLLGKEYDFNKWASLGDEDSHGVEFLSMI